MGTKSITGSCQHIRGWSDTSYEADAAQGGYYTLSTPASSTAAKPNAVSFRGTCEAQHNFFGGSLPTGF